MAGADQPGLYAWARRGQVRFVFAYRPPSGGARRRLKIDEYGAITLQQAREIAEDWRGMVAAGRDPRLGDWTTRRSPPRPGSATPARW